MIIKVHYYQTYHLTGVPNKQSAVEKCDGIIEGVKVALPSLLTKDAYMLEIIDQTFYGNEKRVSFSKCKDGKWHID
jgi:hypothetical protein